MCGIVGIFGQDNTLYNLLLSLHALQHRGQEGIGVSWSEDGKIVSEKRLGFVSDFARKFSRKVSTEIAIGHIRYSTTGRTDVANIQPLVLNGLETKLAICHNGNLVNFFSLRRILEENGSVFTSDMDTEVILHLIASAKGDIISRSRFALSKIKGAYSLVMMTQNELIAVRDPFGFRPLCLGKFKDSYIVASETCALDIVGADLIREIEPGEIVSISKSGIHSEKFKDNSEKRQCIFELIYFARPDSMIFGIEVSEVRKEFGRVLAREHKVDADIVVPVPDSGLFAAIGYAEESKIPYTHGLVRNHYIGRTFIEPSSSERMSEIRIKLNPIRGLVNGKRIVLVDDSIVRGSTSKKIVKLLKDAGAKEVHMRISSPPFKFPCYYGIDTPSRGELIASSHNIEEIRNFLGCESLGYLSIEGMLSALKKFQKNSEDFCISCFTGKYPVPPEDVEFIEQLRLFRNF